MPNFDIMLCRKEIKQRGRLVGILLLRISDGLEAAEERNGNEVSPDKDAVVNASGPLTDTVIRRREGCR